MRVAVARTTMPSPEVPSRSVHVTRAPRHACKVLREKRGAFGVAELADAAGIDVDTCAATTWDHARAPKMIAVKSTERDKTNRLLMVFFCLRIDGTRHR